MDPREVFCAATVAHAESMRGEFRLTNIAVLHAVCHRYPQPYQASLTRPTIVGRFGTGVRRQLLNGKLRCANELRVETTRLRIAHDESQSLSIASGEREDRGAGAGPR